MNINSLRLYARKYRHQLLSKVFLAAFGSVLVGTGTLMLPRVACMTVIVLYVLVNFFLLRRQRFREHSHLVDMLLVLVLLYGTPIDDYRHFAFMLFPLVSRGTYIDRHSFGKYFLLEYVVLVAAVDSSSEIFGARFYLYQALVIFLFSMLNRMYVQQMKDEEKKIKMLDIADDYFIEQNTSYEVYRKLIDYLSNQGVEITSITCLECDEQMMKYHLVNSSYLISDFYMNLGQQQKISLLRGFSVSNVDFSLDGRRKSRNDVYLVSQNNNSAFHYFLFVLVYQPTYSVLNDLNLEPIFFRMARLISFERIIRKERDDSIRNMLQKSRFVNGATNVMHFLKNRLTPLQTLVDLAKNEGGVKNLEEYDSLMSETAHSAQKEIDAILKKAEFLLNKQNNPFSFGKEDCDAQNIFVTLSSIWSNTLPTADRVEVNIIQGNNAIYETNIEGLEILFSDIVGNMNKYAKSIRRCSFMQNDSGALIISFENDFVSKKDVQLLINDINNPNKGAVIYRTSYGVTNIRTISDNLSIKLDASFALKDKMELYRLNLLFEPKRNEEVVNN